MVRQAAGPQGAAAGPEAEAVEGEQEPEAQPADKQEEQAVQAGADREEGDTVRAWAGAWVSVYRKPDMPDQPAKANQLPGHASPAKLPKHWKQWPAGKS